MYEVTKAATFGGHVLSVPVSPEVERVVEEWSQAHVDDLAARLAPLGLSPYDIVAPSWYRVVPA